MNFYEFFAGGGMARIGLGPGWKCTFANDDNHDGAMKTPSYVANFGRGDLIVGDVARLTTSDLPGSVGEPALSGLLSRRRSRRA
jgi:DNA (cytosine-5)-methyltransferase 1